MTLVFVLGIVTNINNENDTDNNNNDNSNNNDNNNNDDDNENNNHKQPYLSSDGQDLWATVAATASLRLVARWWFLV